MKRLGMLAMCAALVALTVTPALAQSVGVDVDGKVYTFCLDGEEAGPVRCEIDGRTFLIDGDAVTVRTPGEPDLHLTLTEEGSADAVSTVYVREETMIAVSDDCATRESGAAEYAVFAPYGLSCDAEGRLYYLGEPVRVFEDARDVDGGVAELSYFDPAGTVDVRAKRDAKGALVGLESLSEAEFAARDLRRWTNPEPVCGEATATSECLASGVGGTCEPARVEAAATTEGEMSPEESAAFFAPYAPFGLRYDAKADKLYFGERPVRNFLDVRQSNGEPMGGGNFHGALTQCGFDGEVDVTVIRDYSRPDQNGDGKILGLAAVDSAGD